MKSVELFSGFDITDTLWFTKIFGVRVNAGFNWLTSLDSETKTYFNGEFKDSNKTSTKPSDNFSIFLFNLFAGPSFRVLNLNSFAIDVVPGLNLAWKTYANKSANTTSKVSTVGIGVDVSANYYFSKLYVTVGCPVVVTFSKTIDGKNVDDYKPSVIFTPKIGVGYKF